MANEDVSATMSLSASVRAVIFFQLGWAVLAALWNIGGLILISQGLRAPGPTASLLVACVLLAYGAALLIGLRRWPMAYAVLSAFGIALALPAIISALTSDPGLWPSEFWRYAGIVLNSTGVLASIAGVVGYLLCRRKRFFCAGVDPASISQSHDLQNQQERRNGH